MGVSEFPPPPEVEPGQDGPFLRVTPPGPQSRTWLTRLSRTAAPMGPRREPPGPGIVADVPPFTVVFASGKGSNVIDVDGNRYVDFAAGFGSLLLGHGHPAVQRVLTLQAERLWQALGDVYPSDARVALTERLARLHPDPEARVILAQSGADAISAALKTAVLHTGRPGVVAFHGAYHGLTYGPLAACGLRESYRAPFSAQLNPRVTFIEYPGDLSLTLTALAQALAQGDVGAVLVEPVLGRGGCVVPPDELFGELMARTRKAGALVIADEIWTGLGRAGSWLRSTRDGQAPDIFCLGKGLGGGLPISACVGRGEVMHAWQRDREVVHTSTFAGAPLACSTAIATLDVLSREVLVERSAEVGARFLDTLRQTTAGFDAVTEVRGAGLMIGIDFGDRPGAASTAQRALLRRGYLTSTGGGQREVLVLTPPLNISTDLLDQLAQALPAALEEAP